MAIATPNVRLVAHTVLADGFPDIEPQDGDTDADFLAEGAGRSCFQSWSRPNPKTRANRDYLANIIRQGHESTLEHASATFYITGVSRALLSELTRHRHLSYSVLSQRYVDSADAPVVIPPALRGDKAAEKALDDWQATVGTVYESMVADLQAKGYKRKQAREAARAVMPNMTETRIVVSGNHRAWRFVVARRIDEGADAEIQEVAGMILKELKTIAPGIYQDM